MYMGEFARIRGELGREKVANANLSERATKVNQQHGSEMSLMRRSHTETTASLKLLGWGD